MRFIFLVAIIVTTYSMVALGETDTVKTKSDYKAAKKTEVVKKAVAEKKKYEKATKESGKPAKETKAKKPVKESKASAKPLKPVKKVAPKGELHSKEIKKEDKPVKMITTTAKTSKEKKPAKETAQKAKASEIQVARAVICKDVVKHEPQGSAEKFAKDIKRLYCFSHIKGVKDTLKIQHKWYYKNKEIGFSNLEVKSSDWRTYSYRDIEEDQKGDWNVKIINSENGEVLKTLKFSVE